jgi:uncharacterized membrane protein
MHIPGVANLRPLRGGMGVEIIQHLLQWVITAISVVGAIVVIWGIGESASAFLMMKITHTAKDAIQESETIRLKLGAHLLLGLEIFIAADIVSSVASPTWERVGILASIVGVRTVLSYFLRMEIKQGVQ